MLCLGKPTSNRPNKAAMSARELEILNQKGMICGVIRGPFDSITGVSSYSQEREPKGCKEFFYRCPVNGWGLNLIIRGWANYRRYVCSAATFWKAERRRYFAWRTLPCKRT